jgi:hypothetical protein
VDSSKAVDSAGSSSTSGGPKVPPLKIVLQSYPSSSATPAPVSSVGGRSNSKDGKDDDSHGGGSTTGGAGFPYVVSSTTPDASGSTSKHTKSDQKGN